MKLNHLGQIIELFMFTLNKSNYYSNKFSDVKLYIFDDNLHDKYPIVFNSHKLLLSKAKFFATMFDLTFKENVTNEVKLYVFDKISIVITILNYCYNIKLEDINENNLKHHFGNVLDVYNTRSKMMNMLFEIIDCDFLDIDIDIEKIKNIRINTNDFNKIFNDEIGKKIINHHCDVKNIIILLTYHIDLLISLNLLHQDLYENIMNSLMSESNNILIELSHMSIKYRNIKNLK